MIVLKASEKNNIHRSFKKLSLHSAVKYFHLLKIDMQTDCICFRVTKYNQVVYEHIRHIRQKSAYSKHNGMC